MWFAVTGDGPNHEKVPRLDFVCLTVIASRRGHGILQPDLVRATGQDKRSVPTRTRRLSERGYIVKKPVNAGGKTSLLVLKRFYSPAESTVQGDVQEHGENADTGERVRCAKSAVSIASSLEQLARGTVGILTQDQVLTMDTLQSKLGISHSGYRCAILSRGLGILEHMGLVHEFNTVLRIEKKTCPSVRLVHNMSDADWRDFSTLAEKIAPRFREDLTACNDSNMEPEESVQPDIASDDNPNAGGQARSRLENFVVSPPRWDPSYHLTNLVYRVVETASIAGISQADIKSQTTGKFFTRPLEHTVSRLVDHWPVSQPPHLRYLGIIRDAAQAGRTGYFIHYSYNNFNRKAHREEISWEAVGLEPIEGSVDVDSQGFPVLPQTMFARGSQDVKHARPVGRDRRARGKRHKPGRKAIGSQNKLRKSGTAPYWTYEEQLQAIPRSSAGIHIGRRVGLNKPDGRGRPRKSQLMVFKSPRLRNLNIPPDEVRELSAESGSGVPENGTLTLGNSRGESELERQQLRRSLPALSHGVRPSLSNRVATASSTLEVDISDDCEQDLPTGVERDDDNDQSMGGSEAVVELDSLSAEGTTTPDGVLSLPRTDQGEETRPSQHRKSRSSLSGTHLLGSSDSRLRGQDTSKEHFSTRLGSKTQSGKSLSHQRSHQTNLSGSTTSHSRHSFSPISSIRNDDTSNVIRRREGLARTPNILISAQSSQLSNLIDRLVPEATLALPNGRSSIVSKIPPEGSTQSNQAEPEITLRQPGAEQSPRRPESAAEQPAKKVAPFGGSIVAARKRILLDIISACGGVFPGDKELWYPFATRWMQQAMGSKPDQRTVNQTRKSLVDAGRLRQVMFSFQNGKGVLTTKSILTLPEVSPSDMRVQDMKQCIIDEDPDIYIPQDIDVHPELRPSTQALKAEKLRRLWTNGRVQRKERKKSDRRASNPQSLPPLERSDDCQHADDLPWSGESSRLHFLPPLGLHSNLECDFEPKLDTCADNNCESCYLNSQLENQDPPGTGSRLPINVDYAIPGGKPGRQPRGINALVPSYIPNFLATYHEDATRSGSGGTENMSHETTEAIPLGRSNELNRSSTAARHSRAMHSQRDSGDSSVDRGHDTSFLTSLPSSTNAVLSEVQVGGGAVLGAGRESSRNSAFLPKPIRKLLMGKPQATDRQDSQSSTRRKLPALTAKSGRLASLLKRPRLSARTQSPQVEGRLIKKPRIRGPLTESLIGPDGDFRLTVAVIVVRTLIGGLERSINWDLVAKIMGLHLKTEILVRRWSRIRDRSRQLVERLTRDFQSMFLSHYASGRIPLLRYDKSEDFDWSGLYSWTLDQLRAPPSGQPQLPASREKLQSQYTLRTSTKQTHSEFFEVKTPASIPRRHAIIHQKPSVVLLPPSRAQNDEDEQAAISRNWVRAVTITPEASYDLSIARTKLSTLRTTNLEDSIKSLLNDRVISREIKRPNASGRAYNISEQFLSRLICNLELEDFSDAVRLVDRLDKAFKSKDQEPCNFAASDGAMLSTINLVAARIIRLHQRRLPAKKLGLTEIGYRTRQLDKNVLNFEVGLTASESFPRNKPLRPLPPIPCSGGQTEHDGAGSKLPIWIDINGGELPLIWRLVLSAVLNIVIVRPGTAARDVVEWLGPGIEVHDIQMSMAWLVEAQAASWVGRRNEAIRLNNWWWMVLED